MPLRTTRARSTSATLAALLLMPLTLTSCGGDQEEKADPTSTTSQAAPSPSTSKASPAARPNSSASAAGKGLMEPSPQGAVHLVHELFDRFNTAGKSPTRNNLLEICEPGCKSCSALSSSVDDLLKNKQHYSIDMVKVGKITANFESNGLTEVHFDMLQRATPVMSRSGNIVETIPKSEGGTVVFAKWTEGGWRVHEIQNVE